MAVWCLGDRPMGCGLGHDPGVEPLALHCFSVGVPGPRGQVATLSSAKWLMWNCCCAGESDCLIET